MTFITEKLPDQYGPLLFTCGVNEWIGNNSLKLEFVSNCLSAYIQGDWGTIDEEDAEANRRAMKHRGLRVMAVYPLPDGCAAPDDKLWVVTDGYGNHRLGVDYCYTTVLWPSEY